MQTRSRTEEFAQELRELIRLRPYSTDPHLNNLYTTELLIQLLSYSAVDLLEVRQHVRNLRDREPRDTSAKRRP